MKPKKATAIVAVTDAINLTEDLAEDTKAAAHLIQDQPTHRVLPLRSLLIRLLR